MLATRKQVANRWYHRLFSFRILPQLIIIYLIAYIDRSNAGKSIHPSATCIVQILTCCGNA